MLISRYVRVYVSESVWVNACVQCLEEVLNTLCGGPAGVPVSARSSQPEKRARAPGPSRPG